jgi:hypothetical protein
MLAKFSIPKFSEWQLFGKQPCVLFGSTRPLLDSHNFIHAAGERYIAVIQCVLKTKNLHPK